MSTATEQQVVTKQLVIRLPILTPVVVYDGSEKVIGAATLGFTAEGLAAEVHLDKHRPETFDLEVNPDRVRARVKIDPVPDVGFVIKIYLDT